MPRPSARHFANPDSRLCVQTRKAVVFDLGRTNEVLQTAIDDRSPVDRNSAARVTLMIKVGRTLAAAMDDAARLKHVRPSVQHLINHYAGTKKAAQLRSAHVADVTLGLLLGTNDVLERFRVPRFDADRAATWLIPDLLADRGLAMPSRSIFLTTPGGLA